jgi:phosphatidate cytidylyltransferase
MTRVISGVILAAAALAAILFLPFQGLRLLACAVAGLASDEYLRITGIPRRLSRWIMIAAVIYTCWWAAVPAPLGIVILAILVIAWLAFDVVRQGGTVQEAAVSLMAPMYIGAPLGMLVALHARAGWKGPLVIIATVIVSDSAQYYTGRAFGRRPLAPAISPKKTVEGAIGGVVFGTLFMVFALGYCFPLTPIVVRVLVGMIVVFLGILGDLFESRLKRLADMKDSSALIPGHGGVLDRIDALLFAIPVFYLVVLQGRVA